MSRSEGGLGDVIFSNFKLMIPRSQIYLREHHSPFQLVKQVINPRQGIFVLHGDLVQLSVVNAQSQTSILLLHEQHRGSPGRHARSDVPLVEKLLKLLP